MDNCTVRKNYPYEDAHHIEAVSCSMRKRENDFLCMEKTRLVYANLVLKKAGTVNPGMNGKAIRDYVTGDAICFVRCGAQCEAFYSFAHSGRNESLPNHKVTSTTRAHLR